MNIFLGPVTVHYREVSLYLIMAYLKLNLTFMILYYIIIGQVGSIRLMISESSEFAKCQLGLFGAKHTADRARADIKDGRPAPTKVVLCGR